MSGVEEMAAAIEAADCLRRRGLSWPIMLGALAFLLSLACGVIRLDADTYWQITTGRWILAHGYVPTHDIFSFTRLGARWIAQEWGEEVLVALVYATAGWSGLTLLAALSFGLTISYLTRFLMSRMHPWQAVVLVAFAAGMMFNYIIVRPHELAWPLTAVWVGELIDSTEKRRNPPWWLLGVMLLWANIHGSFILGLALAVAVGFEAVIEAKEQWRATARRWSVFIAAAFGCALLNPQGWRLLIFPLHLLGMHVLGQLTEWRPPNLQHPQIFSLWLLIMIGLAFTGNFRLPFVRLVLLIGLTLFALQHVRNVSLLGLISPFLIAGPLAALWRSGTVPARASRVIDRVFFALSARGSRKSLWVTMVLMAVIGIAVVRLRSPRPLAESTPRAALDTVLALQPHARILNDAEFGGYLIFRGIPVFVDPRMSVYGDAFLGRYFDALELKPGGDITALLDKYRINAVLLLPYWSVVRLMDRSPAWKRVYAGKWAVAYVRRRDSLS